MRQGPAQLGHDDGTLVGTSQQSNLVACELVVRSYAQEILRTAYLLTDDRQRAWSIARTAFIELFKELPRLGDDVDPRVRLLTHTARIFLAPALPDSGDQVPVSMPLEGAATRFHVDDSRSRTRTALILLDPALRLALLLRDFNGLEIEQIGPLVQKRPDVLTAALETSRIRVRGYVDLPSHEPLRGTLTSAAFDAPAGNLWPALADDAADLLRRAGSQSRMLTVAVLVAVAGALVIALVVLLGDTPEERVIADVVSGPDPVPTAIEPEAAVAVPTSSEQPRAVTTASVPDTLLLALEDRRAADGLVKLTEYRPGSSIAVRPVSQSVRPAREEWPPALSPDGRQMFITRYESGSSETRVILAALDSTSFAETWTAELATLPGSLPLDRKPALLVSLAVDARHVYASLHAWESDDPIRIMAFDLEEGHLANEWPVNLAGFAGNDVRIIIPPGGGRLHLFSIFGEGATIGGEMQLAFFSFGLPNGERIHGKSLIERSNTRVFYIYQGNVTADGRSLYGLTHNGNSETLAVQFFDLASATIQPPEPIRFQVEGGQLPLHEATSHDGRWLYVFSALSAEMAIVDLQARALFGIIPVDVQIQTGIGPAAAYPRDNTMQVSPDGSRIYLAGASADGGSAPSGVLVIDASTWTLTDHWLPQSRPDRLLLSGDGKTLFLHGLGSPTGEPSAGTLWAIDTGTGNESTGDDLTFLPDSAAIQLQTLAALYRQQYGRSPNLEDVQPLDKRAFTSLPSIDASISPASINPGEEVTIDVRFVDPFSGELLVEGESDPRYQPERGVRAVLSRTEGEAADIILELGRLGYAEYRATVAVPTNGVWTLSVAHGWPGTSRIQKTNASVTVLIPMPGISTGSLNVPRR